MMPNSRPGILEPFLTVSRKIILSLALVAGLSILAMMSVTVIDVFLRLFRTGIVGAYDVVRICGVLAISCSLPYVTAVKGHTAIEVFYQKFSRTGRIAMDIVMRLISLALFAFLIFRNIGYGLSLYHSGELMPTLKIPVFWIPFVVSLCCLQICIVIFYHLVHPGEEMIKP